MAEADSGYGGGAEGMTPAPIGLGKAQGYVGRQAGAGDVAEPLALVPASILTPEQVSELHERCHTEPAWTIAVYLDDGVVLEYEVSSMASAREHAGAIQTSGYRSSREDEPNVTTYYPVHRVRKVKVTGPSSTNYTDRARGT